MMDDPIKKFTLWTTVDKQGIKETSVVMIQTKQNDNVKIKNNLLAKLKSLYKNRHIEVAPFIIIFHYNVHYTDYADCFAQ